MREVRGEPYKRILCFCGKIGREGAHTDGEFFVREQESRDGDLGQTVRSFGGSLGGEKKALHGKDKGLRDQDELSLGDNAHIPHTHDVSPCAYADQIKRRLFMKRLFSKKGMEMVQVAILVAIAVALGLIFKSQITHFVNHTFSSLNGAKF